jgi:hypothetical protein
MPLAVDVSEPARDQVRIGKLLSAFASSDADINLSTRADDCRNVGMPTEAWDNMEVQELDCDTPPMDNNAPVRTELLKGIEVPKAKEFGVNGAEPNQTKLLTDRELVISTTSVALTLLCRLKLPLIDSVDPSLQKLRTDNELPRLQPPRTDTEAPSIVAPPIDKHEANLENLRKESDAPMCARYWTDTWPPIRAKLRNDIELPSCRKSKTAKEEPRRPQPMKETDEEMREKLRRDSEAPTAVK